MKKLRTIVLLAALTAGTARSAESPTFIPFQGRITDQGGSTYTNGQFTILFQLYNQAVGGAAIWQERHDRVGVVNGLVNVFLGSITPLTSVDFGSTRHLGITIDADNNPDTPEPEMVPRQMIIPAFWAKNSEKLAGFDWSEITVGRTNNPVVGYLRADRIQPEGITAGQLAPQTITAAQIVNNTITSQQLAGGIIGSNQLAANAVNLIHLVDESVTLPKLKSRLIGTNVGVGGLAISQHVTNFATTATTNTPVPQLTVHLVSTGRPTAISFIPNIATNIAVTSPSYVEAITLNTGGAGIDIFLFRNGVTIGWCRPYVRNVDSYPGIQLPPGVVSFLDATPPPGTNTYAISIRCQSDNQTARLVSVALAAYEF